VSEPHLFLSYSPSTPSATFYLLSRHPTRTLPPLGTFHSPTLPAMIPRHPSSVHGKLYCCSGHSGLAPRRSPLIRPSTFGANTLAHFWTLKTFLPAILARGSGHVVTMSSVLGVVGCAQMSEWQRGLRRLIRVH
jgi:hypothetical protein